jgi:cob(I)alamin adenosyltransferase
MTTPIRADLQPRLVHIYTGPSKGKTTASVGLAVRARGAGWKVLYCSFFKPDGSSEHDVLQHLGIDFKRFAWRGNFFRKYTAEELEEQRQALAHFLADIESIWEHYDLLVMDEIVYAIGTAVTEEGFLAFLDRRPVSLELVMTGRDFPQAIKERAQYVTEMTQVKHPFDNGFLPRKGVEF